MQVVEFLNQKSEMKIWIDLDVIHSLISTGEKLLVDARWFEFYEKYTRIYKGDEKLIFAEGRGLVRIEKLGLMQKVNFGY